MKLLTEKQAAKLLQISRYSLARLRKTTEVNPPVPYCNLGQTIRYNETDLLEWAKTQRTPLKRGRH